MESTEHLSQRSRRLSAITQSIGFALWQLQELESVSAQYFVLLALANKGMGLDAGNALVENAQAKTFGFTLRQLLKAGLLSSELATRFTKLLEERNWLVHKSRATSRSAIYNDGSMRRLLARLDGIAEEALLLLKEVGSLSEVFVRQHGVSEQYINENAQKLLQHWQSG